MANFPSRDLVSNRKLSKQYSDPINDPVKVLFIMRDPSHYYQMIKWEFFIICVNIHFIRIMDCLVKRKHFYLCINSKLSAVIIKNEEAH